MPSESAFLTSLKLELAYFSGRAWQSREIGGAGVILRFERVLPRRGGQFQPLKANEITPKFLDRTVRALKRWKYEFVTMDEACRRAVILPQRRRFVCLSFDGAYKDVARAAYPILVHHRVPFTVYLPTAFPDGVGAAWWLALEKIIAMEDRISLVIDRNERHFSMRTLAEKNETHEFLSSWLRQLPPPELTAAIGDLCKRYSVDLAALTRVAMMDWSDLAKIAADPLVTIGCATVNYPVLSNLKDGDALREMTMGKAVAEAAFHREVRHFAFPFGDRELVPPRPCDDGEGCRIFQRGLDHCGHRGYRGPHQSARAASHCVGRADHIAARDARGAFGRDLRARAADTQAGDLAHDPEKWEPVFPCDKREAFARRSCAT